MGGIAAMVGIGPGAGAQGLGWSPQSTGILNPVTKEQAQTAYDQSQQGIANQAAFLQALQAQNGISNQSSVYNQLQGVASGTGPNPAQAMLANATGANTANQAALMAGQRGAGSNVGLIGRQAAMQGAANQQNAAGQAAAMQAQQSLGALNQLGGLATQQVGQQAAATGAYTGATQGEQQNLLNAIAQQNTANVTQQANLNNNNQAQAAQGAKSQAGLIQGIGAAFMAGGGPVQHYADGGPSLGVDTNLPQVNIMTTPTIPAVSPQAPSQAPAKPGVPKSSFAQSLQQSNDPNKTDSLYEAGSTMGQGIGKGINSLFSSRNEGGIDMGDGSVAGNSNNFGASQLSMPEMGGEFSSAAPSLMKSKGGTVPAMLSPGEVYLPPDKAKAAADGKVDPIKAGKKVPGKAKVKGDSLKNDTVPATLKEGGFVIPKSIMESDDPHGNAAKFVAAHLKSLKR